MSDIRTNTISDLAGTGPVTLTKQSAAKAWANLNGTGTIVLRDSANVSSVTDSGTGLYEFNLTNSMVDTNYAPCSTSGNYLGFISTDNGAYASGLLPIISRQSNNPNTAVDNARITMAIFGDLA